MVDDLIADAMADALDISVRADDLDFGMLVAEVAEANRKLAGGKEQELTSPSSRASGCAATRRRLREAVDNLVSNAVKYSPIGGRIDISAAREGKEALVRVADQGPGLSPEDMQPALRPLPAAFGQADRRRKLDRPRPLHRQTHHRPSQRAHLRGKSRFGGRGGLRDRVAAPR